MSKKRDQESVALTPAETLAQAALRAYFDDPIGFNSMDAGRSKKAARAVEQVLRDHITK